MTGKIFFISGKEATKEEVAKLAELPLPQAVGQRYQLQERLTSSALPTKFKLEFKSSVLPSAFGWRVQIEPSEFDTVDDYLETELGVEELPDDVFMNF